MTTAATGTEARHLWHPVAAGADLAPGHIFHTRLLGEELALWRDAQGAVNAWENRCPHRGVRLTIGRNCGKELECRYHGLRFESQTGRCVRVPAHPGEPIPDRLRIAVFATAEKHGLVWACLGTPADVSPVIVPAPSDRSSVLRALAFAFPAERVRQALDSLHIEASRIHWLLQPTAADRCVVHGLIEDTNDAPATTRLLRECNQQLGELRDRMEGAVAPAASRNPLWRVEPAP